PRVHAERAQDVTDVIAHGLDAEMQLDRDRPGGAPVLEQAEHFGLTGSEVWMRRPRRSLVHVRHLPEDADHPVAPKKRHRAQLDADALAVGAQDHDLGALRTARAGAVPG